MPQSLLSIPCSYCYHEHVHLVIGSLTVLTVRCPQCARTWSIEVAALPLDTRQQLTKAREEQY